MYKQTNQWEIALLGNPILRKTAVAVTDIHDPTVQSLIDSMLTIVISVNGVGLASPQMSKSLRIIIIASHPNPRYPHAPHMEPTPMINPVISRRSKSMKKDWEGCLSVPGIRGLVPRHTSVTISYTDRTGRKQTMEYTDFIARIIQHETDHLNGILFLDRLETNKDLISDQEYLKLISTSK